VIAALVLFSIFLAALCVGSAWKHLGHHATRPNLCKPGSLFRHCQPVKPQSFVQQNALLSEVLGLESALKRFSRLVEIIGLIRHWLVPSISGSTPVGCPDFSQRERSRVPNDALYRGEVGGIRRVADVDGLYLKSAIRMSQQ